MNNKEYSFVGEIASSYEADEISNGKLQIRMIIPKRFKSLAMIKMSELKVTDKEIIEYEGEYDKT
jgi:hypothetical protein